MIETHSNHVAHSLAAAGMGLTLLPEHEVLFRCPPQPGVYFSIENREYFRTLCLCHHQDLAATPAMQQFIELIRATVKELYDSASLPVPPNPCVPESGR